MPKRQLITKELANLLGVLGHPHRIRIIEELRNRELDVNSLQQILGISHSSVSQNLSVLRSHRLVVERREGRHVIYSLSQPRLAAWILDGLQFVEGELSSQMEVREAAEAARNMWSPEMQSSGARVQGGMGSGKSRGTNGGLTYPRTMPGIDDDSSGFTN